MRWFQQHHLYFAQRSNDRHRLARARAADAILYSRGNNYLESTLILVKCVSYLAADDAPTARQQLRDTMQHWTNREFHAQHFVSLLAETVIDLYGSNGESAWQRLQTQWRRARDAQMLQLQILRAFLLYLRACAALASVDAVSNSAEFLQYALKDARQIERERVGWCVPFAELIRACVARQQGNIVVAAQLFRDAARHFEEIDLLLYSAAARRREGECTAGENGRALIEASESWMKTQGIRIPLRMTAMLAP